jgi:hypothetical protein
VPDTPKPAAPTLEKGYAGPGTNWWAGNWDGETTPELMWPLSVFVYDAMRRQDAQVASVLRAVTLPIRRTAWRLDATGCRPEVAALVSADLGLPIVGQTEQALVARTKDRFSWSEHLRLAMLMLPFGHMFFEQVYRVDEAGFQRLAKVAPRLPKTIAAVNVAPDGGLISIEQEGNNGGKRITIPVTSLVAYTNEREGGNWLGQSLLRTAYKNWVIKDRLLRVQAQTVERNGMGVPLYKGADGETDLSKGAAMAQAWRSGDNSGAAVPSGADLVLRGVEGQLPDADVPIRYHDEQIARAVLAHFLNLGTQTGSWALGSTFADFFTLSLQALAMDIADTATQHIVEDLVDVNFGTSEPSPRVVFDEIGSQQVATAQALKLLFDAGAIFPDRALEESLRQQYGLPPKAQPTTPPPTPPQTGAAP